MGIDETQIGLFRHGKSTYNQRETSLEEACDLAEEGVETIQERVRKFSRYITKPVRMYSSPFGRTLHSAKTAVEVLRKAGINIDSINLDEDLAEVKNFQWNLFKPLIHGGQLNIAGHVFQVPMEISNPDSLSYQWFLMNDQVVRAAENLQGIVPDSYIQTIRSFERPQEFTERMHNFLRRVSKENRYDTIAFTHEALLFNLVLQASLGTLCALNPGDYVHLQRNSKGLYAKTIANMTLDEPGTLIDLKK